MQLEKEAGIEVTTVMHKSGSRAMNAMLGGHVDAAFISLQWCLAARPQGCPIFAVASDERTPNAPNTPIFKEFGYDVECVMARVLIAPAGTPAEALQKITDACDKIGQSTELAEKVNKAGAIFKYRSGKVLKDYFKRSNEKILKLVGENKDAFLRGA
jgi:tripartite-type tricarboxylate transporter receptor subunit TctC